MNLLELFLNNKIPFNKNVSLTAIRLFEDNLITLDIFDTIFDLIIEKDKKKLEDSEIQNTLFYFNDSIGHKAISFIIKNELNITDQYVFYFIKDNFQYYDQLTIKNKLAYILDFYYCDNYTLINPLFIEIIESIKNENISKHLFKFFNEDLFINTSMSIFQDEKGMDNKLYKNFLEVCFEKINFLKSFTYQHEFMIEDFLFCSLYNYYFEEFKIDIDNKATYLEYFHFFDKEAIFNRLEPQSDEQISKFLLTFLDNEYLINLKFEFDRKDELYNRATKDIIELIDNTLEERRIKAEIALF